MKPRLPFDRQKRLGTSILEMMILVTATGGMMFLTVRTLHLGTQVNASTVRSATHLRLAASLEERLRSDIQRATQISAPAADQLQLTLADQRLVLYRLAEPDVVERCLIPINATQSPNQTNRDQTNSDEVPRDKPEGNQPIANQRWRLSMRVQMQSQLMATPAGTLVKIRFSRPTDADDRSADLREIEVSEVANDR